MGFKVLFWLSHEDSAPQTPIRHGTMTKSWRQNTATADMPRWYGDFSVEVIFILRGYFNPLFALVNRNQNASILIVTSRGSRLNKGEERRK
jgi:hypothetical protein